MGLTPTQRKVEVDCAGDVSFVCIAGRPVAHLAGDAMSRTSREQSVEFVCVGTCDDHPCWLVEGRFEADGSFMPIDLDDANCPECGERGESTEPDVDLADF